MSAMNITLPPVQVNAMGSPVRQTISPARSNSMSSGSKRLQQLKININGDSDPMEESFNMDGDVFVKGDIAINSTGVAMRNNPKKFTLLYEELEIGELIGRGSTSIVMSATHAPTNTKLALKVINLFERNKREQLIREIITLYDAQCPSLITFYGAFHREGSITIALEYMDGGSLANVLDQVGPIPEYVLASVAFQVLWGLAYLHHDKRVHRDLKPSNLLINSKGEVKVTDFGVSAELVNSIAQCGTFVGTYKYMSPERISNNPYGYMSDIWSLGVVLHECATGLYPFDSTGSKRNCIEVAQSIIDGEIPELPTKPARLFSSQFQDFLFQCMRKNPNERLPADILLQSPWLLQNGATNPSDAINTVHQWIQYLTQDDDDYDDACGGMQEQK